MTPRKAAAPSASAPSFEESLRKLEEIVDRLDRGDVPLEESLRLYEEGIALSRLCGEKLTKAELTLKRLGKDMEGHLALFEDSSEE
jgi:exodeoxyribonuclease VII small subunit